MKRKANNFHKATKPILLMFVFVFISQFFGPPHRAQFSSGPGQLIVRVREDASMDEINLRYGTRTRQQILGTNFYEIYVPEGRSVKKIRKRLKRDPDVVKVYLNDFISTVFARSIMSFPDSRPQTGHTESEYRSQSQLVERLSLNQALRRSRGAGVVVAVIDTGVDFDHPALAGHLYQDPQETPDDEIDNDEDGFVDETYGWDFYGNDKTPQEEAGDPDTGVAGHGTFIAGLIALVAPECRIMPVRAFSPGGDGSVFIMASAITYAVSQGAQIISLSCGTVEDEPVLREAIEHAREQGVIVVAAFGNQGTDAEPQYPASQEGVIGVAAVDEQDRRTYFSNYGSRVSVSAPGYRLYGPFPGGGYAQWSGTSFAAPLAAAEAALILAADADTGKTRSVIEETALRIDPLNPGFEGMLGRGRIDPLSALRVVNAGAVLDLFAWVKLNRAGDDSIAEGEASAFIYGNRHYFALDATGLDPSKGYRLVANGERLTAADLAADLTTNNFGGLKILFSSDPGEGEHRLPATLQPVTAIKTVELRDDQDQIVLRNDFAPVPEFAPPGEYFQKEARIASDAGLNATGTARVGSVSNFVILSVEVDRLADGAYELFADGKSLGQFNAEQGFLAAALTSDGSSGVRIPQEVRPAVNIRRIEVMQAGRVVASGDFQITSGSVGSVSAR